MDQRARPEADHTVTDTVWETTGESFLIIDDPEGTAPLTRETVRHIGVDHAGVIRSVRCVATAEAAELLDIEHAPVWFFDYWLPDGTRGMISGNGLRAYATHLLERGWIRVEDRRDTIPIGTRAGVCDVLSGIAGIAIDLGRWRLLEDDANRLALRVGGVAVEVMRCEEQVDGPQRGVVVDPADIDTVHGVAHANARVIDGDQSRSSGIGAAAAAIALRHWFTATPTHHWRIRMPAGDLGVRMFPTEDGEHVSVSGPHATVVAPRSHKTPFREPDA